MKLVNTVDVFRTLRFCAVALGVCGTAIGVETALAADERPNACPVDGCIVKIVNVKQSGKELELTFESNFSPKVTKNHFHIWWKENFTVKQVGKNAKSTHGVTQGRWHLTDNFPNYVTRASASTGVREGAKTMCVSASDRGHIILDINVYHCVNVADHL